MNTLIIVVYALISIVLCQSCRAESQSSYDLAVQQAEKFKMPVVISHQAIEEHNSKKKKWELFEFDGIKIGYAKTQDLDKILNVIEENIQNKFIFSSEERANQLLHISASETDFSLIPETVSMKCGIRLINNQDIHKKITFAIPEAVSLSKACEILVLAMSINDIKMEMTKDNEFRLAVEQQ